MIYNLTPYLLINDIDKWREEEEEEEGSRKENFFFFILWKKVKAYVFTVKECQTD